MSYVLQQLGSHDQEKILSDADERTRRWLLMRGGYFENEPDLQWAVDRDKSAYLMRGPTVIAMSADRYFLFFYLGKMYSLRVIGAFGPKVAIDNPVDPGILGELQSEIRAAFGAHQLSGRAFSPEFV